MITSVSLVEAENSDSRLLRVSDQRRNQVLRDVLPYIRARLAFELDHAKFPIVMEVVSYILSIIWTIIVDLLFYVVTAEY